MAAVAESDERWRKEVEVLQLRLSEALDALERANIFRRKEEGRATALQLRCDYLELSIELLSDQLRLADQGSASALQGRRAVAMIAASAGAVAATLFLGPIAPVIGTLAGLVVGGAASGAAQALTARAGERLEAVESQAGQVVRTCGVTVHPDGRITVIGADEVTLAGAAPTAPRAQPAVDASVRPAHQATASGAVRSSGEAMVSVPPAPSSGTQGVNVEAEAGEARAEAQEPTVRTASDSAQAADSGAGGVDAVIAPQRSYGDPLNMRDSLIVEKNGERIADEGQDPPTLTTEDGDALTTESGDPLVVEEDGGRGYGEGEYGTGTYGGGRPPAPPESDGGWQVGSIGFGGDTRGLTEPEGDAEPLVERDDEDGFANGYTPPG